MKKNDDILCIVKWFCPACNKVTDNIVYRKDYNNWTIILRFICLDMTCVNVYEKKFIRGDLKPTGGV